MSSPDPHYATLFEASDSSLRNLTWADRPWSGQQAYSDTKLHDPLLAFAIARRWPSVLSNALEPGWVPTKAHSGRTAGQGLVDPGRAHSQYTADGLPDGGASLVSQRPR